MTEDDEDDVSVEDVSEERGRQASIDGFAHEHIALGILMKKYANASLVDLPLSYYDILVVLKNSREEENFIRCQVKTAKKSISFTGGTRGGKDRTKTENLVIFKRKKSLI